MRSLLVSMALVSGIALGALPDARRDFRELSKEYSQEFSAFESKLEAQRKAGKDVSQLMKEWDPRPAFVEAFNEKAEEYQGQEGAVAFLFWVVQNDVGAGLELPPAAKQALSTLLTTHSASSSLQSSVSRLSGAISAEGNQRSFGIMNAILAEVSEGDVMLTTMLARGVIRVRIADRIPALSKPGDLDLALADFERVSQLGGKTTQAEEAQGFIFQLKNLRIGMQAPEISAADLDGINFKLSDYRGEVVMLDFWGDW
jgi:hypothetical protein